MFQSSVCLTGFQSTFVHDKNISYYWGHRELVELEISTAMFVHLSSEITSVLNFLFVWVFLKNPRTPKLLVWGLFPLYFLRVTFILWTCSLGIFLSYLINSSASMLELF